MKEISDEGCSGENGSGRDLPNGNRIEQLLRSEPAAPFDKFRAEKGEQHVSAAKKHRAYFHEGGENGANPDSGCDSHATGVALEPNEIMAPTADLRVRLRA